MNINIDPTKKAFTLFDEFKNFAFKGNIVDLTVGFIIGAGFTAVVKSAVDNIVMPLIALVMPSKAGFEGMVWNIGGTLDAATNKVVGGSNVMYGKFIGDMLVFVVTAFVVFITIVKFLGWVMKAKKQEVAAPVAPPAPPAPTKEELLLGEIRDILKAK